MLVLHGIEIEELNGESVVKNPLLTIFCVTFNHANYICDCFEGFLAQKTDFDYKIVVFDDASNDGTTDIVREYCEKHPTLFQAFIAKENIYKNPFREKILSVLKLEYVIGKYVAGCEGDDYWIDENKLQKQVDYMEKHPECILCTHNCVWYNCKDSIQKICNEGLSSGRIEAEDIILQKNVIQTASFFYRRELLLKRMNFFDCSVGDYSILLCALTCGYIYYDSSVMSVYRYETEGSWSKKMNSVINNGSFIVNTNLGIVDFLYNYNEYTNGKYKKVIIRKIWSCCENIIETCCANKKNIRDMYKICMEDKARFWVSFNNYIDMLEKVQSELNCEYVSSKIMDFIEEADKIYVMGIGKYSNILTEKLTNSNIDFEGYIVSDTYNNPKEFRGKRVFGLKEIFGYSENVKVLVGILILDKGDIVDCLEEAHIANYIMPFNFVDLLECI